MDEQVFFASAPAGVEPLLAMELAELGVVTPQVAYGGISFQGTLELAYRACLWSRTASRILLRLAEFAAADAEALYVGVNDLAWEDHLEPDGTLSVEFSGGGPGIDHSHYGALRIKDAIVDRFRARYSRRPNVDVRRPDVRIHVHWRNGQATVSLDLSGESLYRRGYREATIAAPLKETLAAALLLKADWPAIAAAGGPLLDPFCGSGTFVIEAAWIAGDRAPGLLRNYWGFNGWLGHIPMLWNRLFTEAQQRCEAGRAKIPQLFASDCDPKAVRATLINVGSAGIADRVRVERREWATVEPPLGPPGLLIANPPYGERLNPADDLSALYVQLGERLKSHFIGWRAALFTGVPELGKRMGLRACKTNTFHNGPLECRLLQFQVEPDFFVDRAAADRRARTSILDRAIAQGAEGFINRLRKNSRHLHRWAEREGVSCYRLYDADLPEYAVAIDRYERWLHVQEYAPPPTVNATHADERLKQVMAVLPVVLEVPPDHIFLKVRQRQKGAHQYQKQAEQGRFHEVCEGPARLWVNFSDYLDTGLFLDHRLTRQWLREQAHGRRFLNLFGYTGTATVHAALGAAASTTTVDASATYLDWAHRNLALNGVQGSRHHLVRADCQQWLAQTMDRYDLIFLDPPTFSNSRQRPESFDIQRDHVELLQRTLHLLSADGVLIFSTNSRKFQLDTAALTDFYIEDWSRRTLPVDFTRNPKIHRCWRITKS